MQCSTSNYDLFVEVPPKFKGVVDQKDYSGDDASDVLALLLAEGCSAVVRQAHRARNGRFAHWEGNGFSFRNFLLNTSEVAASVDVTPAEIVNCVKAGVLTAYPTPNESFWFVVKDAKLATLTHMRVIAAKIPMERSVKCKGLTRLVSALSTKCQGFPVSDFGVDDLKSALKSEVDWTVGSEYEDKSLFQTMNRLEKEKRVVRLVGSPRGFKNRRWSFVMKPVVSKVKAVSPAAHAVPLPMPAAPAAPVPFGIGGRLDALVDRLAGEVFERVESKVREMMSI